MADQNKCPCCGRDVEGVAVKFQVFKDNDVQEVFRIGVDRKLTWAPDVAMQDGAQAFADLVNELIEKHG